LAGFVWFVILLLGYSELINSFFYGNLLFAGIFFNLNLWGFLWCGAGLMRLVFEIFDRVLEKKECQPQQSYRFQHLLLMETGLLLHHPK
jgi:hypothetical protein